MSSPDMAGWFDGAWMLAHDRSRQSGWETLSRRDQVLVAVGFVIESCIGDGVTFIVDGVVEGTDV